MGEKKQVLKTVIIVVLIELVIIIVLLVNGSKDDGYKERKARGKEYRSSKNEIDEMKKIESINENIEEEVKTTRRKNR